MRFPAEPPGRAPFYTGLLCCGLFSAFALIAFADEFSVELAGVRGGFSANEGRDEFHQAEAGLNFKLPMAFELGSSWRLQARLDLSAGWLADSSRHAFVGTLGPGLLLSRGTFPLSFEAGSSPTFISRSEFANRDLGSELQFTSFVGFNYDLSSRVRLSYRLQHMSNAGLSSHNPGLNMHMFGFSYLF